MATLTFVKFYSFVEAVAEKKHDLGADQLKLALTNTAPSQSNTQLSDITEISYTNLSSRNVTTSSSSQTSGTYRLKLTDSTLTASGAVAGFRYIILYNDTSASDLLIGYWDYGSTITLTNGQTVPLDFDGTNGVLSLA